ncbi:hypothetical protein DVJ83_10270 [Deinococcus wulumuqiensis]|uniref:Uncharacterized protein n=1 Tax=Deinococcus wulumuqiensis TaxID=980427 RepID=A0A345IIC8_9DEIO|nr:hypothetical protein DVJ83_10270 [Deinococcus wulumuqiensis]
MTQGRAADQPAGTQVDQRRSRPHVKVLSTLIRIPLNSCTGGKAPPVQELSGIRMTPMVRAVLRSQRKTHRKWGCEYTASNGPDGHPTARSQRGPAA